MKHLLPILAIVGTFTIVSCDRSELVGGANQEAYTTLAPRLLKRTGASVDSADSVLISVAAGTKVIDTTYPYSAHRGVVNHVPVGQLYALTVRGFNSVNTSSSSSSSTADTAKTRVTVWVGTDTGTAVTTVDSATAAANAPTVTVDTATPLVLGLKDSTKHLTATGTVAIPVTGTDTTKVLRYAIDAEPTASSSQVPASGKIAVTRTCRVVVRTFQKISGTWVGASVAETLTVHVVPTSPTLSASADSATASVSGSWNLVDSTAKYLFYVASDTVPDSVLTRPSHLQKTTTALKATVSGLVRGQRYALGVRTIWGPDSLLRDTGAVARASATVPQDSTISVSFTSPGTDTAVAYATRSLAVTVKTTSALAVDSVLLNGTRLTWNSGDSTWTGPAALSVGLDTLKAVAYAKGKTGTALRKVTRSALVTTSKPVITRISPTKDSTVLYTGQTTDTVQVQVIDSNAVSEVTIGTFPASYDSTKKFWLAKVTLLNGWNTYAVEAVDAAGNEAFDTVRIFADLLKPTLTLVSPSTDTTIYDTNRTTFRVEIQATDSVGVASVTIGGVTAVKLSGTNHWVATTPATNDTVRISVKDSSGNDTDRVLGIWHHYFIDSRDNQKYNYVRIGTQTWMAQNLNYRDTGTRSQDTIGACYNAVDSNCTTYGRWYTWSEAMNLASTYNNTLWQGIDSAQHQGICPRGWRVPTDGEWSTLVNYVDSMTSGTKLKSAGGWYYGNGTDAYGFRVLPASFTSSNNITSNALFWSSSEEGASNVWGRSLDKSWAYVSRDSYYFGKTAGITLRCVKDN